MIQVNHFEWGCVATMQIQTNTFRGAGMDTETALNDLLSVVQRFTGACMIAQEEILEHRKHVGINSKIRRN